MAFFKAKVLCQRKDGMYVVDIRITQNRKSKYIRTSWVIDSKVFPLSLFCFKHRFYDSFHPCRHQIHVTHQ